MWFEQKISDSASILLKSIFTTEAEMGEETKLHVLMYDIRLYEYE